MKGQDAVVFGKVGGLQTRKAWKSRVPIAEGWIEDGSARIKVMWFNQPYLAKMLVDGMYVKMAGKVTGSEGKLYIANPEIENSSLSLLIGTILFSTIPRILMKRFTLCTAKQKVSPQSGFTTPYSSALSRVFWRHW